jgi:hypothetical protein
LPRWVPRALAVALTATSLGGLVLVANRLPDPRSAPGLTAAPAVAATPAMAPVRLTRRRSTAQPSTGTGAAGAGAARAGTTGPGAAEAGVRELSNFWGADISFPQCAAGPPAALPLGFVIVGLNDGRPFTTNPCLGEQLAFARTRTGYAVYANIDAPYSGDAAGYGRQVALDILARLHAARLAPPVLWLDVELANHWSTPAVDVAVIRAAVATLATGGVRAGIYSSPSMWAAITGDATLSLPVWTAAVVSSYTQLPGWCATGLGGHPAAMAQYVASYGSRDVDVDVLCSAGLPGSVALFGPGSA